MVEYPIELNTSVAVPGAAILNLPVSSVCVAVAVPFTLTVTPGRPLPFLSVTIRVHVKQLAVSIY